MITIRGKYNFAHVFIDEIDETTREQIESMMNHPAFANSQIRIMPDCHAGAGSVVGFTAKLNEYVIPNVVGVDIGCGIYSYNLGKLKPDFPSLDNFIRTDIPHGFNIRNDVYSENGEYNKFEEELGDLIDLLELDKSKVEKSAGSLGGGNHFIEFGEDDNGDNWLTVHSGSRNFGLQVATFFQKRAKDLMKESNHAVPSGTEYLPMEAGGKAYLDAMRIAQNFAHFNREIMAEQIIRFLRVEVKNAVFSVHNYIDFSDNIIRKGAIRAYEGEKVVIPFNMRDGLIIAKGKSSQKWNYSAPHGAGRIMSRKQAKKNVNLHDFSYTMKDIYTTCMNKNTLDEAPFVYKDKEIILNNIKETVDVELWVKPKYNFKSN